MATLAGEATPAQSEDRFFLNSALVMAAIVFVGFSFHLAMGRSTFASPPIVHAHAIVFMGWIVLYVLQNVFVSRSAMTLHRRLGWVAAGWMIAMVVLGCVVTVRMVQSGRVPFFFTPLQFLVFDPLTVFTFAGLTIAAIALRRQTQWHRRLHYCGMSLLMGPALGRLLPSPLFMPWAFEAIFAALMLFPIVAVLLERRRTGAVHPAWGWGIGTMLAMLGMIEGITYSPVGLALYQSVAAGTPGAAAAPLAFGPLPPGL